MSLRLLFFTAFFSLMGLSCVKVPSKVPQASLVENSATPSLSTEARKILVASWNVRNLFDSVDDENEDEVLSPDDYQEKLGQLAEVIDSLDADFLAVQEVENIRCLQDLNDKLQRPFPQLGLIEGNDTIRGIDVGFLSRIEVKDLNSHARLRSGRRSRRSSFSRDCLEVRLATSPPITLLVNHLKSARGDSKDAAQKRRRQAEAVLEIAQDLLKEKQGVIVLGDLNDTADSWALAPLFETFEDCFSATPKKERVTHRYRNGGSAIDHILVDSSLSSRTGVAVIRGDLNRDYSDHNPVQLELTLAQVGPQANAKIWTKASLREQ